MRTYVLENDSDIREIERLYANDSGTRRRIRLLYVNDAGVPRQIFFDSDALRIVRGSWTLVRTHLSGNVGDTFFGFQTAMAPDGNHAVVAGISSATGGIFIYDYDSEQEDMVFREEFDPVAVDGTVDHTATRWHMRFSADGSRMLTFNSQAEFNSKSQTGVGYVYSFDSDLTPLAELINPDSEASSQLGHIQSNPISGNGEFVAGGSSLSDINGTNNGRVHIWRDSDLSGNYQLIQTIPGTGATVGSSFNREGTLLSVGSYTESGTGILRIYRRLDSEDTFTLAATLDPSDFFDQIPSYLADVHTLDDSSSFPNSFFGIRSSWSTDSRFLAVSASNAFASPLKGGTASSQQGVVLIFEDSDLSLLNTGDSEAYVPVNVLGTIYEGNSYRFGRFVEFVDSDRKLVMIANNGSNFAAEFHFANRPESGTWRWDGDSDNLTYDSEEQALDLIIAGPTGISFGYNGPSIDLNSGTRIAVDAYLDDTQGTNEGAWFFYTQNN